MYHLSDSKNMFVVGAWRDVLITRPLLSGIKAEVHAVLSVPEGLLNPLVDPEM